MNYKIIIFSTVFFVCSPFLGLGQQGSIHLQRRALNAALNTVDEYLVWSTISNDEAYYEFLNLFANKESMIYNDLLGVKTGNALSVEEYAKTLRQKLENKKIFIRNIRNEGVFYEEGKTLIRLSLDKEISYIDSCGTYYSSSEFYENNNYRLTLNLDYDSTKNECKIIGINGRIDSPKKLAANHFAFQRTSNRDNSIRYKGEMLKFNSYDQTLLDGDSDPKSLRKNFSYDNPDMGLIPQSGDCQVTMRYKMRRFRLRPYFAIGLGKAFSLDGDDILSNSKSSGMSFGLDFGMGVLSKRSFSMGVYTGVGLSMSSMDLSYVNKDYSFESDADVDGDNYTRHYENLDLSQKIKINELNIPLYFDFDIKLAKSLSLYVNLGARFDLNMSHKIDVTEGSAYVYGMYPKYGNLRLDEHWGFNGFGTHQYNNADLLSSDLIDVNSFTICGLGGFGLRYNLHRIPLSIEAGMNIVMGLTKLVETSNVSTTNDNQIVYNTVSGRESTEHVHNLTEMLNSIKRQQLRIHIGMIYKF